jgi:DNA invertase Pin-like site-specific DNA recombinase
MKFGYVRVSTADQNPDLQTDALLKHGVDPDRIYVDIGSGRNFDRPELRALLKALRQGDELVVWRLDRIGRSTKDLLATVEQLGAQGIDFTSLHERIETSSAGGKLMLTVFAAIAAFERDLLIERTNAGLASARARGRKGGRPQLLKKSDVRLARTMLADKTVTVTEVAQHFGVGRNTLYRALGKGE